MDSSSDYEAPLSPYIAMSDDDDDDDESVVDKDSLDFSSPWHFSDVVLVVEGTRFHVHKSTLSRWSPVFEAMFTSQFLESTAREIPLPGKRAEEVEQLLKVIYSDEAKQKVSETNYEILLELAREYQMDKVRQYCAHYMKQGINENNCLHRYNVAERFTLPDVMKKCNKEARFKFSYELESSPDFCDLGFESKFNICMARMKALEDVIRVYEEHCSSMVNDYYDKLTQYFASEICQVAYQCINTASHEHHRPNGRVVRKRFDSTCKYCRKRMVSRHISEIPPVNAMDFDDTFILLYDMKHDKLVMKLF